MFSRLTVGYKVCFDYVRHDQLKQWLVLTTWIPWILSFCLKCFLTSKHNRWLIWWLKELLWTLYEMNAKLHAFLGTIITLNARALHSWPLLDLDQNNVGLPHKKFVCILKVNGILLFLGKWTIFFPSPCIEMSKMSFSRRLHNLLSRDYFEQWSFERFQGSVS